METNEDYNPPEKMYYNYSIKNFLIKDVSMFADTDEYSQIILCVYTINTSGKFPFLNFLLYNNGDNKLSLPVLPLFNSFNRNNLTAYSKVFLSGILQNDNFEDFNTKIEFDGFHEYEKDLYLFFDITNYSLNINEIYLSSHIRFCLTDEIINHRHVCNIQVDNNTTNFFLKNESINYLYDKQNEAYEIPVVGYVGKPTPEKLNFVFTFGESAKNKSAFLGPYYYFTDFYYAIRQGGWTRDYKPEKIYDKLVTDNENGRYNKGGIVRFALFTGKTKYIENMPNDPNDKSSIKRDRLNDPLLNTKYEVLTLRISDHDGIWAETYDSAYLGNIELDDGSLLEETPILVLKDYNQQIPLSYHFIDKTKLEDRFNTNSSREKYSIV